MLISLGIIRFQELPSLLRSSCFCRIQCVSGRSWRNISRSESCPLHVCGKNMKLSGRDIVKLFSKGSATSSYPWPWLGAAESSLSSPLSHSQFPSAKLHPVSPFPREGLEWSSASRVGGGLWSRRIYILISRLAKHELAAFIF